MKRNVFKKRYCPDCKCLMELADTLGKNDPYVGYYEVKGAYKQCPVYKKKYLNVELALKQLDEFKKIASGLLLKNFPPDKYEYLSKDEALNQWIEKQIEKDPFFQIRGDFLWECDFRLIVNQDFAFNAIWNGKLIFLKKSFDLFLETGNGFFDITKPE